MVFFTEGRKTEHYKEFHERDFPFEEVMQIIEAQKIFKKKGDKFVIETNNTYILFEVKDKILYIINAKRK